MVKILELFAGIGACSKALERLGIEHEIVDAVEIDKFAIKSFNAIHETEFETQDITRWDKDIQVDLIMHGSPCQDFSLAGKQAGGDEGSGTRSSLMYETIRIVEKLKPKYVIWENVKNVISKKHKHNFDNYINRMNELGYNSYYQVLNAKDYGIPQNRERVFTISIRKDLNIEYSFPNKGILNKNLQELLESNVEEKYFLSEKGVKYVLKRAGGYVQLIDNNTEIAHCPITAKGNTNWTGNFVKYEFPPKEELKLKLKDMLEDEVDEKYYLSKKMVDFFIYNEQKQIERGNGFRFNVTDGNVIAKAVTTRAGGRMDDNFIGNKIYIKNATKKGYLEAEEGDGVDISSRMQYHRGNVQKGMIQTLDCQGGNSKGVVVNERT